MGKEIASVVEVELSTRTRTTGRQHHCLCAHICITLLSRVIPKSTSATRQKENMAVFDFTLSEAEMAQLSALNINLRYNGEHQRLILAQQKWVETNRQ